MKNIYEHFLKVFLIIFSLIIVSIYLSSIFIEKIYIKSSLENLKNYTEKTIQKIVSLQDTETHKLLTNLSEINNIRITIVDEQGNIVFDSHSDPKTMENHLNREEVLKSLKFGYAESIRLSNTLNVKMAYYAKKLELHNKAYVFRTAKEISDLADFIRPYKSKFTIIFGGLFLLIFSFSFLYFRKFANKLDLLQSAIRQISKGNFDTLLHLKKNDILYDITKNVNILAQSLKHLTEDINTQKELLYNVLENLPFPVVIAEESREILVENKFFREFFGNLNHLDQLANLIRDENLYDALKNFEKEPNDFNIQINFKDLFFSIFGNKIIYHNKKLILLTFIDITEIKKTEKMKTDFTANVSHELKTPITVLKGYIETLEDEVQEDKKAIVKILKKHIERLSNLVSDVLLLSRLDAKVPLEKELFNINEIISNAVDTFSAEIEAKKISLQMEIDKNLYFYGDSFLIFQAVVNLISNAVKYTPENGKIKIDAFSSDENLVIKVMDSGQGIPKEYHEKIFQRFFVIDKSRSKQLGGTGLGLSIVKHIVELHNGKITLESEIGKGATFIIILPITGY